MPKNKERRDYVFSAFRARREANPTPDTSCNDFTCNASQYALDQSGIIKAMSTIKKVFLAVVLVLAAVGLLAIVSNGLNLPIPGGVSVSPKVSDSVYSGRVGAPSANPAPNFPGNGYESAPSYQAQNSGSETTIEGALTKRKIVQNGYLGILVKNSEEVSQKIQKIASDLNGFVQDVRVYEVDENTKNGTVTIRVPADRFAEAMDEVKKLAVKVESENVNAQDVTEQFVDLEAQLKNYRLEEQQYQDVLKKAQRVDEILSVHAQLARVRGDIERIEGQLKYLSRQVDMSSITVNMTAEAEVTVLGVKWRPLYEIKVAFRSMLESLVSFLNMIIGLVVYLPVIILWLALLGILFWLGRKIWFWVKGKLF